MSISSLFQFIIGFFLGIIFFTVGIAGGAYFFLTTASQNPEKHIFAEEKSSPQEEGKTEKAESKATKEETKPVATEEVKEKEPEVKKEEEEPKKVEAEKEELPDGAYYAKVTWSTGLSLRAEPTTDAQRVGGVGYNSKLIVLSTTPDGDWQKIRLIDSGQEAWVKAGNVEKVTEETEETEATEATETTETNQEE